MMLDGQTLDKTNAWSGGLGYATPAATPAQTLAQIGGMSRVNLQDEVDWAALLIAVRDRQDKAAFAALFRHFAPRHWRIMSAAIWMR